MSPPLLVLASISTGYGRVPVLRNVSINANLGEITTIIGANGAGKTTTLLAISRFLPLLSGAILLDGLDISELKPHELLTLGIAHVPEGRKIFPRLTVLENLELGAFSRPTDLQSPHDFDFVFDLFPILAERKKQLGGTLSGGEQQMLAVGRALMCRPRLLLLDEPSMGVAPLLVEKIFETIRHLNKGGMTIVLVEQNAQLALELAHRAYVLELGEVTLSGLPQTLLANPRVREAYIGA